MAVATGPELLTLEEASDRFGLTLTTLRSLRNRGVITRYKRGDGRVLVDAQEIAQEKARREQIVKQDDND